MDSGRDQRQLGQERTARISLSGIGVLRLCGGVGQGDMERGEKMQWLQPWALSSESLRVWSGSVRRHIEDTHTELSGPYKWALAQGPGLDLQSQLPPLKIVRVSPALSLPWIW